jgi:hypothetical protein
MRLLPLALVLATCVACSRQEASAPAAEAGATASAPAAVAPTGPITLRIKDHKFVPAELEVPANVKFELLVVNEDPTPEEFESHELNREKIVTGNGQITVSIGPLKPGRYPFFGEFHMDTAQGALIAK